MQVRSQWYSRALISAFEGYYFGAEELVGALATERPRAAAWQDGRLGLA